jgi:hypothetical protein
MSRIDNCHSPKSHGCGDDNDCKPSRSDKSSRSDDAENVKLGEDTYDLSDEDGRAAFEDAIFNADTDAEYDADENTVTVGKKKYDLDDASGREAFRKDARDGQLDGKARNKDSRSLNLDGETYDLRTDPGRNQFERLIEDELGGIYNQHENKVTIPRDDGPDRTYDLDTPEGRRAFKRDVSDGELDGHYDREAAKALREEKREARRSGGCDEDQVHLHRDESDKSDGTSRSSRNGAHLRDVEFNGKHYNLRDPGQEERFRTALMKDPNVTYFAADNMVMVGDKTYDLDNPEDFHAFRQDMADRKLDGLAEGTQEMEEDIVRHRHHRG